MPYAGCSADDFCTADDNLATCGACTVEDIVKEATYEVADSSDDDEEMDECDGEGAPPAAETLHALDVLTRARVFTDFRKIDGCSGRTGPSRITSVEAHSHSSRNDPEPKVYRRLFRSLWHPCTPCSKRSLDLNQSPHVEYLRQCVLTALQAHGLSAPRHELATLVKCLRQSESAQAQQLSLALLNLAAQKYPEEVLHNVTSVFTFMGANLLRLDDNYSFQTVMQTVETVVPALLQACAGESKSAEGSESAVASVTRVFVGAFPDIPEHRRLPLFTKLATTLGASDHLWVLAAQMAGHHITKMAAAMDTDESTSNILEFGLSLCGQFEVSVQMQTITHLLKFAASLPAVKDNDNEPPSHPEVFDMRLYSEKQLQRFRLSIANFVADLLGSSTFLGQMAVLQGGKGDGGTTEALCGPCLSACLQFVPQVSRWSHSPAKTPYQERAWKALLSKLHDVVHKGYRCDASKSAEHSEASDRIAMPGNAKKYRTVHALGRRKRKGRGRKSTKSSEPLVDSDERCVDAPRPFSDGATERVAFDDDDGEANSGRLRIDAKVVTNAEVEENHAREKATLDRLSSAPATARKIDFFTASCSEATAQDSDHAAPYLLMHLDILNGIMGALCCKACHGPATIVRGDRDYGLAVKGAARSRMNGLRPARTARKRAIRLK
ncbi:hypothetical protein HPB51_017184 [Rhipicephalus microplus]|uniref:HEAT repeat-containing protein 1 n=1 Tax=Rhipicephalus microplus TaxID=6941 RepID=A0A9J6EAT9_RHIMP|nr:hypothetical protein HPB51_017184 [Rhipicephalus microplus]